MKVALSCACSVGYTFFLLPLLKSIIVSNPGKQYPFYVFCHRENQADGWHCLPDWDRHQIENTYSNVHFIDVDVKRYNEVGKSIKYYSLEAFALEEYDKVIYYGADMLNVKSLDEMVSFEGDICLTLEQRRKGTFNNGGMIIGKKYLSKELRDQLIAYQQPNDGKYWGTDQALINYYFEGRIIEAPQRFNTLVTEADLIPKSSVVNYHYIIKPNTHNFIDRCGRTLFDVWQWYQGLTIDKGA